MRLKMSGESRRPSGCEVEMEEGEGAKSEEERGGRGGSYRDEEGSLLVRAGVQILAAVPLGISSCYCEIV